MHTGNQPPFAGGLAQQDLPGTPGLFRIDVEGDRGFWPRRLNGREMDDIPPDQQRGIARFETIPGMPGRMAGQRARADPGDHLLIINPADLRRAVRQYTANKQHVAPAAIAGVVERGCCQPVSAFPRRQEHRGVGIRWRTSGGQQAADMVRMGVGEKDGVDLLGTNASRARLAISSPPTPLAPPCRYPPAPYSRDRGSDRRQSQWSPARLILNAAADVPPPPVRYPRVRTAALTSDHHSRQSPSGRQRSTYKREQVTWRPHARCAGLRNRAVMG